MRDLNNISLEWYSKRCFTRLWICRRWGTSSVDVEGMHASAHRFLPAQNKVFS